MPVEVIQHVEEWVDVPVEQIQYEDIQVDKYRARKTVFSSKFSIFDTFLNKNKLNFMKFS